MQAWYPTNYVKGIFGQWSVSSGEKSLLYLDNKFQQRTDILKASDIEGTRLFHWLAAAQREG